MKLYLIMLCTICSLAVYAQEKITIQITDRQTKQALPFVTIINGSNTFLATSDSLGQASVSLPDGMNKLSFIMTGYIRLDTAITLPGITLLSVSLEPDAEALDEVVIVTSTRNNQNIENSPLKVEVLGATELGEEAGIKPGNIASILGDVSGVQIQQSSATSGNSNVRIQGLDGRYTQILRDGMPLYDGFSGGFGILTVPPLDLKQIELIKGSASTLYGGGAIGGLVNLVSKRPTFKQSVDAIINYTTLKEYNTNLYLAKRNNKIGYTMFTGYTGQKAVDVNNDGLSDVPNMGSLLIHPRMFYYPSDKTVISLGYSGSFDDRKGGDMRVLQNDGDSLHKYYEQNTSQRHTGEYLVEQYMGNEIKLTVKGNLSNFNRIVNSSSYSLEGNQTSYFNEASVLVPMGRNDLVTGITVVGDDYIATKPDTALLKSYSNFTIGAFGQYSLHIRERTTVEAGLRTDWHRTYGLFALPRVAVFHRFSEHWAARAGFGMGYKVPNPLVQQNIDYNPMYLLPVTTSVKREMAYGYNAEANYKKEWDNGISLFVNQAFFLTQVERPIIFQQAANATISLINASSPVVSKGSDTYVKLELHHWELYLGYTLTDARNTYLPANTFVPLTPRHRGAFVVVKEIEKKWRFGLEGSYFGNQYRYDATTTPGYFFIAAMVQRNIGKHIAVVLNGENLLDYRMSRVESLYNGSITNPAFKPLWAPIDGRVINISLRWKL